MAEGNSFSQVCIPKFDGDYDHWSLIMENLLRSKEYWSVVQGGYTEPEPAGEEALTPAQRKTLEEARLKDLKAKNYLFNSIDKAILKTITQKATAKQLWDSMKVKYQGNARVQRAQLQTLRRDFELLEMRSGETVNDYFGRVMVVANDMRNCGEDMPDVKIVEKILRTLTENFNYIVCSIKESKDIDSLSVDALQSSLLVHEQKFRKSGGDEQALKVSYDERGSRGRGASTRGRGRGRGRQFDKATVECYKCHQLGHFQYECPSWNKKANYAEIDEEEEMLLMAFVETNNAKREEVWFLDSGCSNHMCGKRQCFSDFDGTYRHSVKLGNNTRMEVMGKGNIWLKLEGATQVITDVYYVPDLKNNLLSIGQLQERGLAILIKHGVCKLYHPRRGLIMQTWMTANRMFVLLASMVPESSTCLQTMTEDESQLWHRRYGHLSYKGLRTLRYREMVKGIPPLKATTKSCTDCLVGKQHREAIPKRSQWRASKKLQLVHADICGPITPSSNSDRRYILTFIDDYSRKVWIYFLIEKSEAFTTFKHDKSLVEKESGVPICSLRTDRGGEFTSTEFNTFCKDNGISRQLTAAYTPQQNGVAERKNRTIMNMVRCMLTDLEVPKRFWPEAARWTTHVLNRSPTSVVKEKTPEEMWSGIKPKVDYFRVFGCLAHVHVPDQKRKKLDDKSFPCVLLGVSDESKAYRLFDPATKKIVTSRDVSFEEDKGWNWGRTAEEVKQDVLVWEGCDEDKAEESEDEDQEATVPVVSQEAPSEVPPAANRSRRAPPYLQDYVSGEGLSEGEDESNNLVMFASYEDPCSFEEAAVEEKWRKAMDCEMESIEKNETWQLTPLPTGAKKIGVKWVFKTKLNENGEVDKYKARLVAKGYAQQHGIDYNEVFAPVARWDTIRTVLALAAQKGWSVYQLDVKSAFLHGDLDEDVYVEQPLGYVRKGEEQKVYKLRKALYGLKQAPRAWYSKIEAYFLKEGFTRCNYEHTLFVKSEEGGKRLLIISLYVDDLIFTGNDACMFEKFKSSMKDEFEMTDLGKMKYFLGVEIMQKPEGIYLSQKRYAGELLERFHLQNGNSVKNPIVPGSRFSKEGRGAKVDATLYKQLIGSLMYITATRPDLMYVTCLLSRYMASPTEMHMQAAKRVLRYLKGTVSLGLFYKRGDVTELAAYTDSDYAGDIDDRRSTSGYVFLLNGGAVSLASKKQPVVTLSTTEAEFVAAAACACQCVWMRRILEQLDCLQLQPTTILCDNSSTIKLSKNPVLHGRSKHIDVRFHFLRDLTKEEVVRIIHCGTKEQVADIMTKPLKLDMFIKLREELGVCEVPLSLN